MNSPFKTHFNSSVIAYFHSLFDQCATLRLFKDRRLFFFWTVSCRRWRRIVVCAHQREHLTKPGTWQHHFSPLYSASNKKKIWFHIPYMISSLLSNLVTSSAPLETDYPKFTCLRTVKQRSKTLNNSNQS